ncbi:MAG: toll/interleukin-1 receptor domain-containing protein [Alphaproteobacteria bacterium]|nr:MAG: toll/interleukin-1 receptor domain-containing protein [Alphaproteobacteria bacterium]
MARSTTTTTASSPNPLIFISYCHRDEAFRERLMVHLAPLQRERIEIWVDSDLAPGDELDPTIRRALRRADIFVALASPDYLHSRYCFETEYGFALRKAKRKKVHVVVAIARHCQWKRTRIGRYLVLPKEGKAIEDFGRRSQAFEQIVEGIRVVLKRIKVERDAEPTSPPAKVRSGTTAKAAKPKPAKGALPARTSSTGAKPKRSTRVATTKPIKLVSRQTVTRSKPKETSPPPKK